MEYWLYRVLSAWFKMYLPHKSRIFLPIFLFPHSTEGGIERGENKMPKASPRISKDGWLSRRISFWKKKKKILRKREIFASSRKGHSFYFGRRSYWRLFYFFFLTSTYFFGKNHVYRLLCPLPVWVPSIPLAPALVIRQGFASCYRQSDIDSGIGCRSWAQWNTLP